MATSVASATKHFPSAENGFTTTLASTISSGAVTVPLNSVAGYANGEVVVFIVDPSDAAKKQSFTGTIDTSGVQVTGVVWTSGTNQTHTAGSTVVDYVDAAHISLVSKGLLVEHNQTGTHSDITATSITATTGTFTTVNVSGTATSQGWTPLGDVPDTVTANGNRNYDIVFNGVDHTSTLSPGMKLQLTRTVAAPSQCTSLNGSSQYFNKTSPAGMTFTDDFVVSAWVKLNAYGATDVIASRYNGTSGWDFVVNSVGQIVLSGYNAGSTNLSKVTSYASIPLNKWVHIAAQLDMSTFTASTTTSYVMFDGVDVAAAVARGGSNPTALIQAGNLEIGTTNGAGFFNGKLAQVAIYSAKVTQATIKNSMDRTLTGSETSLISAYSFDNSINDLNANANNLTAQGSAVATNADSPFANAVTAGLLEYAEVNSVTFSTNTTVNVRVPDTCQIPTTGGVSAVSYSTQSNPYGLPYSTRLLQKVGLPAFSTTSTSAVQMNGASLTTVVPAGGTVKVILYTQELLLSSGGAYAYMGVWSGTVGSGTLLAQASTNNGSAVNVAGPATIIATYTNPSVTSSASVTFNGSLYSGSGARTATTTGGSIVAQYMSVELV